jgi:hypothetical protein
MRKSIAALAVLGALFAGAPAHADDVDGDTSVWFNTGETGLQTVTFNVTVPTKRSGDVLMKIAGDCEYDTKGIPNTNDVVIYAVGHTSATPASNHGVPGGVPVSVGVKCSFTNTYGELTFDTAAPGAANVNAAQQRITMSPFTMCITVSVHYQDDYFVRTNPSCRMPISPI